MPAQLRGEVVEVDNERVRAVITRLTVVPDLGIDVRIENVIAIHQINCLRPGPGGAEHQAVREPAIQRGLHRMITRIGGVFVVLNVAEALYRPEKE